MNQIPLIGQPQQLPQFPHKQVNVTPQGWVIALIFGPDTVLTTTIARQDVENLIQMHRQMIEQEQIALRVAKNAIEKKL